VLAALLAGAALLTAGCTSTAASGDEPIGDRPVRVTTTTNFITDTVQRIGGANVEVTGLMGPGVDPHLYRASAGDVAALREADVILYGGLNLEGRMASCSTSSRRSSRRGPSPTTSRARSCSPPPPGRTRSTTRTSGST
jgi:manganese/zinc/iron transport system substrate-binding protein